LPDDLFRLVDARARALKISRSALLAKAAREFLEKGTPAADATASWNAAIECGGQPGDDPAALAFRRRAKRVLRARKAKKR
jgi:predicted transcriptional regulator